MSIFRRLQFDMWYFFHPPWDSGISPPELLSFLRTRTPGRAIDIGCGTGTNAITLAKLGWQVTALDFSGNAIRKAKLKGMRAGVSVDFFLGDITRIDEEKGPFEFALDLGCFHGLQRTEKDKYLLQLNRSLSRGCIWFLYAFINPENNDSIHGITITDLEKISALFRLRSRINGFERKTKPSAYFIFERLLR